MTSVESNEEGSNAATATIGDASSPPVEGVVAEEAEYNTEDLVKEKGPEGAAQHLRDEGRSLRVDNIAQATVAFSLACQILQKELGDGVLNDRIGEYYMEYGDALIENVEATIMRRALPGFIEGMCKATGMTDEGDDEDGDDDEGEGDAEEGALEDKDNAKSNDSAVTGSAVPGSDVGGSTPPDESKDANDDEDDDEDDDDDDDEAINEQANPLEDLESAWQVLELAAKSFEARRLASDVDATEKSIFVKTRLGDLLLLQKQYKEAVGEYETALEYQKSAPQQISQFKTIDAVVGIQDAYDAAKDTPNALKWAETAVALLEAYVAEATKSSSSGNDEDVRSRSAKLDDIKTRLRDYKVLSSAGEGAGQTEELKETDEDPDVAEPSSEIAAKVINEARKVGASIGRPDDRFAPSTVTSASTTIEPRREAPGGGDEQPSKKQKVDPALVETTPPTGTV